MHYALFFRFLSDANWHPVPSLMLKKAMVYFLSMVIDMVIKHPDDLPIQQNWSREAITVLGCRIAIEESVNWDDLITKFENQLTLWKRGQLSFRSLAQIANVLGLSLFLYLATVFDMPKTIVLKVNKILFPFARNKKRKWMSLASVVQPLHQGGLGVVDILQKLLSVRAVWLRRFFCKPHHPWSSFFSFHVASLFSNQSVVQVLSGSHIPACLINKLPPLYRGILTSWVRLKGTNDNGSLVIPRPSIDPIANTDLTAKISYSVLARSNQT